MSKYEMPVVELVSFSAEDIIRTSNGSGTGADGFAIGNEYKKAGRVNMGNAASIIDSWAAVVPAVTED